jgi:adenine specific DNA methylase Mod
MSLVCYDRSSIDCEDNDKHIKYESDTLVAQFDKKNKKISAKRKMIQSKHSDDVNDIYINMRCSYIPLPDDKAAKAFQVLADHYEIQKQERGAIREPEEMEAYNEIVIKEE